MSIERGRACAPILVMLALVANAAGPREAAAQCSEQELTAVFLVSGIHPGTALQIERLDVVPVGEATNPSEAELLAAVEAFWAGHPWQLPFYWRLDGTAGNFHLYRSPAGDFGAVTILDGRTGAVVFAGEVIWMGCGGVVHPPDSSHAWIVDPDAVAPPPAGLAVLPNLHWSDSWGTAPELTERALALIRRTDVLHSFASCGAYEAVGYTYTPSVGMTDPFAAIQVVLIGGRAEPPWGPVGNAPASWRRVKALYR